MVSTLAVSAALGEQGTRHPAVNRVQRRKGHMRWIIVGEFLGVDPFEGMTPLPERRLSRRQESRATLAALPIRTPHRQISYSPERQGSCFSRNAAPHDGRQRRYAPAWNQRRG